MSKHRRRLTGIGASPGRAVGEVVTMAPPEPSPPDDAPLAAGADPAAEADRLARAVAAVARRLEAAGEGATGAARELLQATATMAADPALLADARARVLQERCTAARAVWDAAESVRLRLVELGGDLAERARDVADVRDRVVAELEGRPVPRVPQAGGPAVLVATDLAPADAATLDPGVVVALVTAGGGPTAHTVIVARALGIPAVVGVGELSALRAGATVLVDGSAGTVLLDPTPDEVDDARTHPRSPLDAPCAAVADAATFDGRGRTRDGYEVALLANVGGPREASAAAELGAAGIGLLRTEFCFLGRDDEPSVEEQATRYREVFASFPGRRVVVRTLDAGSDKPLPFVSPGGEPNPALGVRGVRTAVKRPGVLDNQLTAVALAAADSGADVAVMAPMVATADEAEEFAARCRAHGLAQVGVMIEVPAAALLAGRLLTHVDFASIGTNDLAQYVLAADRQVAELAPLCSPWQPAVLTLVAATCHDARELGRPVDVCGEAAADPVLAPVLMGLGVGSLSMLPRDLPAVAAALSRVTLAECAELARLALDARSAQDARDRVLAALSPRR